MHNHSATAIPTHIGSARLLVVHSDARALHKQGVCVRQGAGGHIAAAFNSQRVILLGPSPVGAAYNHPGILRILPWVPKAPQAHIVPLPRPPHHILCRHYVHHLQEERTWVRSPHVVHVRQTHTGSCAPTVMQASGRANTGLDDSNSWIPQPAGQHRDAYEKCVAGLEMAAGASRLRRPDAACMGCHVRGILTVKPIEVRSSRMAGSGLRG